MICSRSFCGFDTYYGRDICASLQISSDNAHFCFGGSFIYQRAKRPARKGTGTISGRKMKKQIVIAVLIGVFSIVGLIWCLTPVKLMEFSSSDGSIRVVISRHKIFAPSGSDYNIKIKKNDGIFGTTLLNEDFWFDSFHHGQLDENDIEIKWYDDYVEVFIKFSKGRWHSFTAEI